MKRRDLIRMTEAEVDEFLHGRRTLQVATIAADGRPHLVAMWYGFYEGAIAFWTYAKSQKIVNLRRDPRMACLVEGGHEYSELKGVELVGTGRIVEDRATVMAVGRSVAERYMGVGPRRATEDGLAVVGAKRVAVVLEVDHVVSWDHSKLGGTY